MQSQYRALHYSALRGNKLTRGDLRVTEVLRFKLQTRLIHSNNKIQLGELFRRVLLSSLNPNNFFLQ